MAEDDSGYTPNYDANNDGDYNDEADQSSSAEVVASEPAGASQEELTESDTTTDSSGDTADEDTISSTGSADAGEQEAASDRNAKVIASEPSGSSQAELTESDTTKKNGEILDEDQVIKEKEVGTQEQENFSQIEKQLKQVAQENSGRTGRQAGNALQALKKAQRQGQATVTQTQNGISILSKRKTSNQNTPPSVGERITGTNRDRFKSNDKLTEFGNPVTAVKDVIPGVKGETGNTFLGGFTDAIQQGKLPTEKEVGNPNATLLEELTTAGVDLTQAGQKFGESVGNAFPTRKDAEKFVLSTARDISQDLGIGTKKERKNYFTKAQNFLDTLPETQRTSSLEKGVARTSDIIETGVKGYKQDGKLSKNQIIDTATLTEEEKRSARKNIVSGVATGPTAVTGLGISAIGAVPRAARQTASNIEKTTDADIFKEGFTKDTNSTGLVKGAATGFTLTGKQVAKNPDKFVGQEVGEEIGEAAVFGTLTGGAGLAVSAAPTPDFEVEPDIKGKAASAKNTVQQMRNADSTTSQAGGQLVLSQVDNDVLAATTQQPDTDVGPGRTPGPRSQANPETDTDTLAGIQTDQEILTGSSETDTNLENAFLDNTRTGAPSLEDNLSQPGSETQPQSDAISRPESDIISEIDTRTETKSEPQSEPTVFADVLAETQTEPEPRLEIQNELGPELNRRPDGELSQGQQEDENKGAVGNLVSDQKGFERTTSVGAELLGLKDKKGETRLSAGNPLNLRPELK